MLKPANQSRIWSTEARQERSSNRQLNVEIGTHKSKSRIYVKVW